MANVYATTVSFQKEKNVTTLYATVVFNGSGVPVLQTNDSKGIANFWQETVSLNANVVNSTTSLSSVSSFAGLFSGMNLTGAGLATSQVISSMSVSGAADGSITVTKQNITTGGAVPLVAEGGRYRVQFGTINGSAPVRYDAYNKLLQVNYTWDMTTSSASGTAAQLQLAPNATSVFVLGSISFNQVTVPNSTTSGSTDASIVLQMGDGAGLSFQAKDPQNGEKLRLEFVFGNSTAR